jgi:hypothetical protein
MLEGTHPRAAQLALTSWINEDRPGKGSFTYHAPLTLTSIRRMASAKPHVVFSPIAQAVEVDGETGSVSRVVSVVDLGPADQSKSTRVRSKAR